MTIFEVNASGQVDVGNVDPSIVSDGFYAQNGVTSKNNTMIDPAVAGVEEAYQVKTTIRDDNTLNDIVNITIYVYDDVIAHGYTKGTYDAVGSYGFQWDSGTWKELTASGWSATLTQLVSANCSAPVLTGSQGE